MDRGRVALDFDVTTHVSVVEPERSELVKEVLVHSLMNRSHTGSRLKAISYAAAVLEPKVRDSLIIALHHDPNLAVRRRALEILGRRIADSSIESAVLQTLVEDESVQMRLEALDYLATDRSETDSIRRTIEQIEDDSYAALMVRLAEYEP
jgi:hypothetical protein